MKNILVPSRSQRNHSSGMFKTESLEVGGRVGKVHPDHNGLNLRVEFPDGGITWVPRNEM